MTPRSAGAGIEATCRHTTVYSFLDGDNAVFEGESECFMETTGKTGKHRADIIYLWCTNKISLEPIEYETYLI